jgi:hypothetical protein
MIMFRLPKIIVRQFYPPPKVDGQPTKLSI